jgi:hypothetical protein
MVIWNYLLNIIYKHDLFSYNRGHKCVSNPIPEVYWTVPIRKPRSKFTFSSIFRLTFGISNSPLFCPFSSASSCSYYKIVGTSYRLQYITVGACKNLRPVSVRTVQG